MEVALPSPLFLDKGTGGDGFWAALNNDDVTLSQQQAW